MTARQAAHQITSWRDWIVLVGLAINLLAVGAMYGDMRAKLSRAVTDIQQIDDGIKREATERARNDERLDDRIIEMCGGKGK